MITECIQDFSSNQEVQFLTKGDIDRIKLFNLIHEQCNCNLTRSIHKYRNYLKSINIAQSMKNNENFKDWLEETFFELIHIQNIKTINRLMIKNNWTPAKLLVNRIKNPKSLLMQLITAPWEEV